MFVFCFYTQPVQHGWNMGYIRFRHNSGVFGILTGTARRKAQKRECLQSWVILSEVLVTVGVVDGPSWVVDSQCLAGRLTISPVIGATVGGEMRGLVNERSCLGIGTCVGSGPEGTAQVDLSKLVGI